MDSYFNEGARLSFYDIGDACAAEVAILLHGFPQLIQTWQPIGERLARSGVRCVIPSQRGYPDTTVSGGPGVYSIRHLVSDIVALLDHLDVASAHIVGHDWGGSVGWSLANHHSERVRTLTVASMPHPQALALSLFSSSQLLKSWYVGVLTVPYAIEKIISRNPEFGVHWLRHTGLPEGDGRMYLNAIMKSPKGLTRVLNWYRALPWNLVQQPIQLPIHVPTTFVWSTEDVAVSRRAAALTGRFVSSDYEFIELPGVSHWIPETAPEELTKAVLARIATATTDSRRSP